MLADFAVVRSRQRQHVFVGHQNLYLIYGHAEAARGGKPGQAGKARARHVTHAATRAAGCCRLCNPQRL